MFKKLIGEGAIGRVHLGRWRETDVAIKVRTPQPTCACVQPCKSRQDTTAVPPDALPLLRAQAGMTHACMGFEGSRSGQ